MRTKPYKYEDYDLFETEVMDYFEICKKTEIPVTIIGLCDYLQTTKTTWNDYKHRGEEWKDLYNRVKTKCEKDLYIGSLTGQLDRTVAIFGLKVNHNYKEVKYVENEFKGSSPVDRLVASIEGLNNGDK